jgi:hypothetical protein
MNEPLKIVISVDEYEHFKNLLNGHGIEFKAYQGPKISLMVIEIEDEQDAAFVKLKYFGKSDGFYGG